MKSQDLKNYSSGQDTCGLQVSRQFQGIPDNSPTGIVKIEKKPTVAKLPQQQMAFAHGILEVLELGKPSKNMSSTIKFTTKPRPQVPHPQDFGQFQAWGFHCFPEQFPHLNPPNFPT